ncbi:hypothetical protein ABZP36_013980 [Zizania latifolia]
MDPRVANQPVKLVLTEGVPGLFRRQLHVTDGEGSLVFRTDSLRSCLNFRLATALVDASGTRLLLFRRKWMNKQHGWEAFRGESFAAADGGGLAFTVEQDKRFQVNATMKLFLARNTARQDCDYRIEGSFMARSLKVYRRGSSQLVAEMVKERPDVRIKGKSYMVSVDRNEDLTLLMVLLAIRHEKFRIRRMNLYTMANCCVDTLTWTTARFATANRRLGGGQLEATVS